MKKINWLGLIGSIFTFLVASLFYSFPWWKVTIDGIGKINISPLKINLEFLGISTMIPLIWFINLTCLLLLITSAIAMLIYSINPDKNYSKHLLNFAYKKPLIVTIIFFIFIFILIYFAKTYLSINIPISGSTTATLDMESMEIEASLKAEFTKVFWLATISTLLCSFAKLYHKIFAKTIQ